MIEREYHCPAGDMTCPYYDGDFCTIEGDPMDECDDYYAFYYDDDEEEE